MVEVLSLNIACRPSAPLPPAWQISLKDLHNVTVSSMVGLPTLETFCSSHSQEIVTALAGKKNIVPVTDNFMWLEPTSLPEDMRPILNFNGIK